MKVCALIEKVYPGSIAEELEIEKGDILLSINGSDFEDIFDYRFLTSDSFCVLEIQKPSGDVWELEIEKDEYEDIGIEFKESLIKEATSCTNKCIFCFIDQLPPNMRSTLYFKDDDSRLSFLSGNYVTLTNVSDTEIDRIIEYKLSPINVSVHTSNPELRIKMLNNKFAGDIITKIQKLLDNKIEINCQIVLVRDYNDKSELDKTIKDLTNLAPTINSISIVPVGITKYRNNLENLKPFDIHSSCDVISQISYWQEKLLSKYGKRMVFLADEFYLMAQKNLPNYDHYEDFPQIENGVGLISSLTYEFDEYLKCVQNMNIPKMNISIATGYSAFDTINELSNKLMKIFSNLNIKVYKITNNYFGEKITVVGLLTGTDIYEQLKNKDLGTNLFLSKSMLKSDEDIFLDNYTLECLSKKLNVKITMIDNSGKDFINKLIRFESEEK